jgi:putative peptidoglycan lipid II flippase
MTSRRTLGLGGAATLVAASVLLSRVLGVLRESLLAALLGVTVSGDLYRNAFVVPDFLNYLLAGGFLSITLIPLLARRIESGDDEGSWRDFSAVFRVVGLLIAGLTAVLWLLAPVLVRAVFPRLSPSDIEVVTRLTRVALPAQVFFVLGALFMAAQYARKRFLFPALAPVVYNLGIIGGGLAGATLGEPSPDAFVWGAVAGAVLGNFALQWWGASRVGLRWHRGARRGAVREYLVLALPLMIGQSVAVLDEQFPRVFGQLAGEGSTAALSFARMLNMLPVGMIAQAAGVASFPFLASLAARGEQGELGQTTARASRAAAVAGVGATALLIATAVPAVSIVYRWGRFGSDDVALVASLLIPFSLAIPAWAIHQVVARWFYANRRMWTPVVVGTAATVVAVPVSLLAVNALGARGVAIASTSVIWAYTLALAFAWLRSENGGLGRSLVAGVARVLPGAALAALAGRLTVMAIPGEGFGSAVAAFLLGSLVTGVVFVLGGLAARSPEVRRLLRRGA